jgi:hypothetical protein
VEFAGGDQAVDNRRAFAAGIASREQPIFSLMLSSA